VPTISLVNQKGECSKSSTTVHLAHWLAKSQQQVLEENVPIVLQAHTEGSSLRGISRINGLA
jgi:hypothetical protein